MAVVESILWIVFTLLCILISGIILLQEGKGGGLGDAFGGAGQQSFGVKAQGIAKFTGWMATALIVIALVISRIRTSDSVLPDLEDLITDETNVSLPADGTAGGAADDTSPAPEDEGN
jgi:preprotein translocase subunit SecG